VRPTYIETNEFTSAFQEIVNTYGIPNYKEINPAIFTIVTFPFLFGVMFGDVMHGVMLLCFATWLCWAERKPGSTLEMFGAIRYLLLMMGLFATFCGLIYNDMTSIPLTVFGNSCYNGIVEKEISLSSQDCVYPFGLDPVWFVSKNELAFVNSLKMKTSVIMGVAQMALGVCMKGLNSLYFGSHVDFFFEFIPQIVLLLSLFGFMDLLIILKWLTNYSVMVGAVPPSVIALMIQMGLNFGEADAAKNETPLLQQ
jgi:V-type H+-transporting ATPase subunit a